MSNGHSPAAADGQRQHQPGGQTLAFGRTRDTFDALVARLFAPVDIQGGSYVLMGLLTLIVLPRVLSREVAEQTSPGSTIGADVRSE